ncbi:MAG: 6-phosphogluconolactonase, partial [Mycobacteriales bacterium]
MTTPTVVVHHDATVLAAAVAARLITGVADVQSARQHAHVVLTGGDIGIAVLRAVAGSPARAAVDWARLDVWWGDERFLPRGDPERNETQARAALLDAVPVDPARVHPIPGPDGTDGNDPEAAAERYVAQLAGAAMPEDHAPVPQFDILLLGIGADGHTASLFPEQPATYDERPVVAVRGAPKPPPVRIT